MSFPLNLPALLFLTTTFFSSSVLAEKLVPTKNSIAPFRTLSVPVSAFPETSTPKVTLFLWYGCDTCLNLEQLLKQDPQAVNWTRLPANILRQWRHSSKTFLVLREMQEPFAMDLQLMDAIHNLGSDFDTVSTFAAFFNNLGVDPKSFEENFYSLKINTQLKKIEQFEKAIGLHKVPAALIHHKYFVDITMVNSLQQFVDTIHYLETLDESKVQPKAP